MKFRLLFLALFSVFFLRTNFVLAQASINIKHEALAEKIYLQLDNSIYTTDKIVWFKAILVNASTHFRDMASGVLYVDLIDSNKRIIDSKIVKIKDGIGNGHFQLDSSYEMGDYLIRAYTEWSKNFDNSFMYETYIQIYPERKGYSMDQTITNINKTVGKNNNISLSADLDPYILDKTHRGELRAIIATSEKVDTLFISKKNKKYHVDYELPSTTNELSLRVLANNGLSYKTTIFPNKSGLDFKFFPESGDLVNGLTNTLGFKAIGYDGLGREVEGGVYVGEELIASFKSNRLGMGNVTLKNVDRNKAYLVKYKEVGKNLTKTIALPQIKEKGTLLKVRRINEMIIVGVESTILEYEQITVKGHTRGYQYYSENANLRKGSYIFSIPSKEFPDGVVAFTLLDSNKRPLAERLFFNENTRNRISSEIILNKKEINPRDKVRLSVNFEENKTVKPISSSLLVTKTKEFNSDNSSPNLLSYLLLASDIKGHVEQPNAYFGKGSDLKIDDLMLTQGWRNYNYTSLKKRMPYKIENGLTIDGVVNPKTNRAEDEVELTLMNLGKDYAVLSQKVPVPGSFTFELPDLYGYAGDMVIQPKGDSEKVKKNYAIGITEKQSWPIRFNQNNVSALKEINEMPVIVQNYQTQKSTIDQFYLNNSAVNELDEVIVTGYRMTPKRKEIYEKYGPPNVVIESREIMSKTRDFNFGLYDVLMRGFVDKITINRIGPFGDLKASSVQGGKGHANIVVVDGKPVMPWDDLIVQYIQPEEVTSFEVIDIPKKFARLYKQLYPETTEPPLTGSIISIYTKAGVGLHGAIRRRNKVDIKKKRLFSEPIEFYMPKYETDPSLDTHIPDYRSPVFWAPEITSSSSEKLDFDFFHSDDTGDFTVILESISYDGKIGYTTQSYTVSDNDSFKE